MDSGGDHQRYQQTQQQISFGGATVVTESSPSSGSVTKTSSKGGEGGSMGRGKIEIKRIENATSRQVTFSKRRGGLLKKAHELSVLCDAQVAVIIFSSTGKLFEFASTSMKEILERYGKYPESISNITNHDTGYLSREVIRLKQQLELSQQSHRQLMGDDLNRLAVKDLQALEHQLEMGLSRIRSRKDQVLMGQIDEFQKKEHLLQTENELLRRRLVKTQQGNVEAGARALDTREPFLLHRSPQRPQQQQQQQQQSLRDTSLQLGLYEPSIPRMSGSKIHSIRSSQLQ